VHPYLCRFFEQQPLDKVEAGREGERRLLYWLVEDGVKKRCACTLSWAVLNLKCWGFKWLE